MTAAPIEPTCKCGADRRVLHGVVVICSHCDRPCVEYPCTNCVQVSRGKR